MDLRPETDLVRGGNPGRTFGVMIEDLLNIRTINLVLAGRGCRSTRNYAARALRKLFYGAGSIGFDAKLNLALAIGLIDSKTKERMVELNNLRTNAATTGA